MNFDPFRREILNKYYASQNVRSEEQKRWFWQRHYIFKITDEFIEQEENYTINCFVSKSRRDKLPIDYYMKSNLSEPEWPRFHYPLINERAAGFSK